MKKTKTQEEVNVLKAMYEIMLEDSHTFCEIDDDEDLVMQTIFSTNAHVNTLVACSKYGYVISLNFTVGDKSTKYSLTKLANKLNSSMREGAFFVDSDGELCWRSFVPYAKGIGPRDLIRVYKTGIETFFLKLDEISETLEDDTLEGDYTIIDMEDTDDEGGDSDEH